MKILKGGLQWKIMKQYHFSTINGKKVKLFKGGNWKEALFEYQGFNFYIETYRITEAEFINLLKSILI